MTNRNETVYYATDVTKLSFQEIWRINYPNLRRILALLVIKIRGEQLPISYGVSDLNFQFFPGHELPPHVSEIQKEAVQELVSEGFSLCFAHTVPTIGPLDGYTIDLIDQRKSTLGMVVYSYSRVGGGCIKEFVVSLVTRLSDGRIISTTNGRRRLNAPPGIEPMYFTGASVKQVISMHAARLTKISRLESQVFSDDTTLQDLILEISARNIAYHRQRGVFVSLSESDVDRLRQVKSVLSDGANEDIKRAITENKHEGNWIDVLFVAATAMLYLFAHWGSSAVSVFTQDTFQLLTRPRIPVPLIVQERVLFTLLGGVCATSFVMLGRRISRIRSVGQCMDFVLRNLLLLFVFLASFAISLSIFSKALTDYLRCAICALLDTGIIPFISSSPGSRRSP
ncbi:MAG: hypothetical protein U0872_10665 [Planctomycetaceae bacterium]